MSEEEQDNAIDDSDSVAAATVDSSSAEGYSVNENDLWLSKYFLIRICEKHDMFVEFDEPVSKEIITDNKKVEYEN